MIIMKGVISRGVSGEGVVVPPTRSVRKNLAISVGRFQEME